MNLYNIILLFILSCNSAYGNVSYVEVSEQPSLAQVLVSYLKVPWINLNSTWIDEVSSDCRDDITMLFESADAGEMWALQMLDATSKIPSGILTGNIRDLGMYDQCIGVKAQENNAQIQGQHCMVSFAMPTKFVEDASKMLWIQKVSIYNPTADVDLSLTASLCFPSSCNVDDITGFVNSSIQSVPELVGFEVNISQVTCSNVDIVDDLFLGRIIVSAFFAVVIGLLLFCTICDFAIRAKSNDASQAFKTIAQFSLYSNMIKLASTKTGPDTMRAIHGIRFINTCFILIGHRTISTLIKPLVNLSVGYELRQTFLSGMVHTIPYVPDTFFVTSGFLTAYLFLKALKEGHKFNIFMIYMHRYIRLTPCVAVLLLFSIFYLPHIGSGPMWETVNDFGSSFCRKNWWTNLLYVQNFVNKEEMCMIHTWYLAVEMQLFWISPIILYPLFHQPKVGLTLLSLLSIIALITPALQLGLNQWAVLFNIHKNIKIVWHEFFNSYPLTYNRALPYLVGIFLGYDVVNNERRFTKIQLVWNWILTCVLVLFSGGITYFIQPNAPDFNVVWEMIYVSIGRLSWSIASAWILYACTQGYGGVLTRFLSLPMFVPLSRMCYSIYLVHFILQIAVNATERTAEYNSPFSVFYLIWGDLALSIGIAFFVTLCFDSPVISLERILRNKQTPPIRRDSVRKTKDLLDVIKKYLDQTRDKVNSDLASERTMRQPNLRRTASEVLKTSLGNGTTRTPAEYTKAWQNWKSYFLRNDNQRETRVEDVGNEPPQSRTEIADMEKELFMFLAGVSCGLSEAPGIESEMYKGSKSLLDTCNWQNENLGGLTTLNTTPFARKRSKFSGPVSTGEEYPNRKIRILP